MKVKELIAKLQEQDPNYEVVLSKDAEGNGFSPLADLSAENYVAENTWSGELADGRENCLVFWPIN